MGEEMECYRDGEENVDDTRQNDALLICFIDGPTSAKVSSEHGSKKLSRFATRDCCLSPVHNISCNDDCD